MTTRDRKTRFHTESGVICIAPYQMSFAFVTTLLRKYAGYYAPIPWIILPAVDFLRKKLDGKELFEFGSGTSTAWYAKRCKHVWSVEDDKNWHEKQKAMLAATNNVTLIFEQNTEDYINSARRLGRMFDVLIIDGILRDKCLRNSIDLVRSGGILVADNTDQQPELKQQIFARFPRDSVTVLSGYAPGSFYAKETTIVLVP